MNLTFLSNPKYSDKNILTFPDKNIASSSALVLLSFTYFRNKNNPVHVWLS